MWVTTALTPALAGAPLAGGAGAGSLAGGAGAGISAGATGAGSVADGAGAGAGAPAGGAEDAGPELPISSAFAPPEADLSTLAAMFPPLPAG